MKINNNDHIQVVIKKNQNYNFNFLKNLNYIKILVLLTLRNNERVDFFKKYGKFELFLIKIIKINTFLNFKIKKIKSLSIFLFIKSLIIRFFTIFLFFENFFYIETPILSKNTIEGAKIYILPSKKKNLFFSLPQSPQLFKQIIMFFKISRYYQISKCFRNEDRRKDRKNEFLQLDIEVSFINNFDIIFFLENFILFLFFFLFNYYFFKFSCISYKKCLKYFFNDKPDLRFKLYFNKIFFHKIFKNYNVYLIENLNYIIFFGKNFKNYNFFLKNKKNFDFIFFFKKYYYKNFYSLNVFLNKYIFEILIKIIIKCLSLIFFFFNINKEFLKIFFSNYFAINNFLNFHLYFT